MTLNLDMRYVAYSSSTARLELHSTGDYHGGKSWNRSSTTINITSSQHGLATGDTVMLRNASSDYVYGAVTNIDASHFSATVADSGGTTGDDAAWIPAFSASVTEGSGDVTAISILAPGALSGSAQLNNIHCFANNQETSPCVVTVPNGSIKEGAGELNAKHTMKFPIFEVRNVAGSSTSTLTSPSVNINIANPNQFRLVGIDDFAPIIWTLTGF